MVVYARDLPPDVRRKLEADARAADQARRALQRRADADERAAKRTKPAGSRPKAGPATPKPARITLPKPQPVRPPVPVVPFTVPGAVPLEHDEQASLIARVRNIQTLFPGQYPAFDVLYAVPNGGFRPIVTAQEIEEEGGVPGIPDLCCAYPVVSRAAPRGVWGALYIEMKRKKGGTVRPAQKAMIAKLRAAGNRVEVCYGCHAAWVLLCTHFGYTKLLNFFPAC